MSYWKNTGKDSRRLDNYGLSTNNVGGQGDVREFYELELGVVLDIVLDDKHPIYVSGETVHTKIDPDIWPADLTDSPPSKNDYDYTWIGRALIRPLVSHKLMEKDQLVWAYPLDNNISEYPLINEVVVVVNQDGKLYYTRKLNCKNWPNNNLDFSVEGATSGRSNTVLFSTSVLTGKKESLTNYKGNSGFHGFAGGYFVANNKIRTIKRWEGDLLFESRHGQTIHLTAYDKTRANDVGDSKYKDYKDGGNPMILIRNRQRPLVKEGQTLTPHKKLPPIVGTKYEKNVGGYLEENINHDGSSIHMTCGKTVSEYVTTCYKKIFGDGEEVSKFQGTTSFKTPTLNGDQIVINTDRLIFSSRYAETLHYSKKRYGVVTDNEWTLDAHQQVIVTTNTKVVINSPAIYLGEYDQTNEPALLGQTTVNWLYELCNWLLEHVHWYHHGHVSPAAGPETPEKTQIPVQIQELIKLRDKLHTLMSRRVFVTGGGLAPGQNGGTITDGNAPVKINVGDGSGVPGTWKGKNYRISTEEASAKYGGSIESVFGENGIVNTNSDSTAANNNVSPNEQQQIQSLQNLTSEQKATVSKGAGCGGRSSKQEGIFAQTGSNALTGSNSGSNTSTTSSAEIEKWNDRIALLHKAGIYETDSNPPSEVDVQDWKIVVSKFI